MTNTTLDQRDAQRWRALLASARIRMQGWAGFGDGEGKRLADPGGYRHFGAEFWTIVGDGAPAVDAACNVEARRLLTAYADTARGLYPLSQLDDVSPAVSTDDDGWHRVKVLLRPGSREVTEWYVQRKPTKYAAGANYRYRRINEPEADWAVGLPNGFKLDGYFGGTAYVLKDINAGAGSLDAVEKRLDRLTGMLGDLTAIVAEHCKAFEALVPTKADTSRLDGPGGEPVPLRYVAMEPSPEIKRREVARKAFAVHAAAHCPQHRQGGALYNLLQDAFVTGWSACDTKDKAS